MEIPALMTQERLDDVNEYISSRKLLQTSFKQEARGIGQVKGQPTQT